MVGSGEVEFGKAHTVEFEAGELLEAFQVRNAVVGAFMDINDFCGQIDEVGEEVTELFDGIYAFATAVISHKQVLNGLEVFRNDEDRAFGMVKGFPKELVGLPVVGLGIEILPADEDQIGEAAFPDKQVFIPFVVVVVEGIAYMALFALTGEHGFVLGDHFFFVVFEFQEGDDVIAGACGGQGELVDGAKEQALGVCAFVFGHGVEKGKGAFGKVVAGSNEKYLFHIAVKVTLLAGTFDDGGQGRG